MVAIAGPFPHSYTLTSVNNILPFVIAVLIVPALQIVTKEETFVFYGNGIQLNDLELPYRNLKETLEYRSTMHPQIADKKRLHRLPFAKK